MPTEEVDLVEQPVWGEGGNTIEGGIAGLLLSNTGDPAADATAVESQPQHWRKHGWTALGRAARCVLP